MTIIDGVPTTGGEHCETTSLGVLLTHAGLALSEPMLFGLGGGLSFIYWDSKQQPLPFLGGRVKPFELTRRLTERLGLDLQVHETGSERVAWERVRSTIDSGIPVGLQLDSHDLEYFGSRTHFAGHVVAMYGYDDERAYLVDTAQQGGAVSTSLTSLAAARSARGPMAARNRSFTVAFPTSVEQVRERVAAALLPAIAACAEEFVTPPIANIGDRGILTAARRIPSWFARVERPERDLPVIAMLMERGGTGGALFRNLYRDFLTECLGFDLDRRAAEVVEAGRDRFAESALLWSRVAALVQQAGETAEPERLVEAGHAVKEIAAIETSAMSSLRTLAA
ncbi:BtrH N-terminal domain-containing protein [Leifsonia sp. F6_8S_P_1B]|uniref:BtrH N-terminal domain-containing protein n=1 Tax=Leifsonia williamsii TaxID=3035919 RepID=A0ABT8K821_9MICO|nr:BtrH N-terminal domain-containing protein [Leifsonia williamsii]MDN4613584.1 BtrH N-terminal domain-containing protein [Leifsonia williamsii]